MSLSIEEEEDGLRLLERWRRIIKNCCTTQQFKKKYITSYWVESTSRIQIVEFITRIKCKRISADWVGLDPKVTGYE